MPAKRKAPVKTKNAPAAKKAKTEMENIKTALTKGPSFRKKIHNLDKQALLVFPMGIVVDDFDCMLNLANIDGNNNKYYVIQMILQNGEFYIWTRWGRVGETGQNMKLGPYSTKEVAEKEFHKKFNDKTKTLWKNKHDFKAVKGKYTLLEMGDDDDNTELMVTDTSKNEECSPSKLDKETQFLIDMIFQTDMFSHAMSELKLDTKKLPLGKLSKPQIMKGFEVLEELQEAINKKKTATYSELTSKFYTIIPHAFGRTVPPKITTLDEVREKMDMLLVLTDIESTQSLLKNKTTDKSKTSKAKLKPNPLDEKFNLLDVDLELLDKKMEEFKIIENYVDNTKCRNIKVLNVWKVNRHSEDTRFRVHKDIANRKLLWHGTNIAVVAAILKSGLRIMPNSGGRVGRGIYFASENGKSAGYVACNQSRLGVMFLNEVALGKEKIIFQDDGSIVKAPAGFESVVAQGITEPDSKFDKQLTIDGKKVTVPIGKPLKRKIQSSFGQSEYLIYQESQCRIRYLLLCQF